MNLSKSGWPNPSSKNMRDLKLGSRSSPHRARGIARSRRPAKASAIA
jgi:hypothetical protein